MRTITNLTKLDELIAKELGWAYYNDSEDCYYPVKPTVGWVPPEWKGKEIECFNNLESKDKVPNYSSDLKDSQLLVNYIHSLNLDLAINSNKYNCCVQIQQIEDDWEVVDYWSSTCGQLTEAIKYCTLDSPINSVPLALCLAFLKYKNIEVQLKLND